MNATSLQRITSPGIYTMSSERYHADPCDPMSLSSTGAKTLVKECPAEFWHQRQHPEHKRAFDIGTAGHLMVLEPDLFADRVIVVRGYDKKGNPSEGYTSADAREQRDAAYTIGKVPLLPAEVEMVQAMRAALWTDPIARFAFQDGQTEQSIFWQDPEFGVWRRTRPDFLPNHRRYAVDYKTSTTANPREFKKQAHKLSYHQYAAWQCDGIEAVTGDRPERFAFVVQSKSAPHLPTTCWLDAEALEWGAKLNRYAVGTFAWCLTHGEWPSYRPDIAQPARAFTIGLPAYALRELETREQAGDFDPPQAAAEAAQEAA